MSEVSYWQTADGTFQTQEQIVWQIDANDSNEANKRTMPNDNRNIVHHIPVTYLTTDNRTVNFTNGKTIEKPVTYVLSHNMIPDNLKYQKGDINESSNIIINEPQKVLLIQELDPKLSENGNVYSDIANTVNVMETRLFKVDGCGNETAFTMNRPQTSMKCDAEFQLVDVDIENNNLDSNNGSRSMKNKVLISKSNININGNIGNNSSMCEPFNNCEDVMHENIIKSDNFSASVVNHDSSQGQVKKRKGCAADKKSIKTKRRKESEHDEFSIEELDYKDSPKKKIAKKVTLRFEALISKLVVCLILIIYIAVYIKEEETK